MGSSDFPPPKLARAYRVIVALAGMALGLLLVVVYLLTRSSEEPLPLALASPEVRQAAIAEVVQEARGFYDSHVDADVGRVNLPNLKDKVDRDVLVTTNRHGMREREYALPKPEGTIRIVLLGDSMVFGLGSPAEERMGVHLERWIKERAPALDARIEVLHLGVSSWNLVAETSWLRRQLGVLRPDLVFHLIVPNDLDDGAGTRGFGGQSKFSPHHRQRADSLVASSFPLRELEGKRLNYLRLGLDYESQQRYLDSLDRVRDLSRRVIESGGNYRLLIHFRKLLPVAHEWLGSRLDPSQVVYLSREFGTDRSFTLSKGDPHWNLEGQQRVSQVLYELIRQDALLPGLNLPNWELAEDRYREIAVRPAAVEPMDPADALTLYGSPTILSRLDFSSMNKAEKSQVNGGLDRNGLVSPYASFLLRNEGSRLEVAGEALNRPELDGARVRVYGDAELLGEIEIQSGRQLRSTFSIPDRLGSREFLSIRFEADDYVYQFDSPQHCVVFKLHSLSVGP